jgi:hypothetical protein
LEFSFCLSSLAILGMGIIHHYDKAQQISPLSLEFVRFRCLACFVGIGSCSLPYLYPLVIGVHYFEVISFFS